MAYGFDNYGASILFHDCSVGPETVELKEGADDLAFDNVRFEDLDETEQYWIWMGKPVS